MIACFTAALMLGAIGSASASAAACTTKSGSGNYQLCVEGSSFTSQTEVPVAGRGTAPFIINLKGLYPEESRVECSTVTETGSTTQHFLTEVGKPVTLHVEPATSGCKFVAKRLEKECRLNGQHLEIKPLVGHFTGVGAAEVYPPFGGTFVTWRLEGFPEEGVACEGKLETRGRYKCTVKEPTAEAVEHEVSCSSSLSETETFSHSTPLSYTEMLSLSGTYKGKKFSIYESS
jgi:hypothetical protein